jgi:aminoglycoside phosphotransferase (APT) family kinase protein
VAFAFTVLSGREDPWVGLVEGAAQRLGVRVGEVLVDHRNRAVFRSAVDGRTVYVKVDEGGRRHRRESAALRVMPAIGVPVPALVVDEPTEPAILVLAEMTGDPLVSLPDHPGAWAETGRLLKKVHDMGVPDGTERFDHHGDTWLAFLRWWAEHESRLAVERGLLDDSRAHRFRAKTSAVLDRLSEPPRRFLHGDLQPEHVLVDPSGRVAGIIDWGDAGTGDPRWDLAVLTLGHRHRLDDVLRGYGTAVDVEVIDTYRLLRWLGEANWLVEHGFDPSESVQGALAML